MRPHRDCRKTPRPATRGTIATILCKKPFRGSIAIARPIDIPMADEACCTCATLLSNITPLYDEKSEKPATLDRRLDCCSRVICGPCIYVCHSTIYLSTLNSNKRIRIIPASELTVPSAKSPRTPHPLPKAYAIHHPILRHQPPPFLLMLTLSSPPIPPSRNPPNPKIHPIVNPPSALLTTSSTSSTTTPTLSSPSRCAITYRSPLFGALTG
jgi:hypothetical protein